MRTKESCVEMCCEFLRTETSMTKLSMNRANQRVIANALITRPGSSLGFPSHFSKKVIPCQMLPQQASHCCFRLSICALCSLSPRTCSGTRLPGRACWVSPRARGGNRHRWTDPCGRGLLSNAEMGNWACEGWRWIWTQASDPVALTQGLAKCGLWPQSGQLPVL